MQTFLLYVQKVGEAYELGRSRVPLRLERLLRGGSQPERGLHLLT